MVVTILLLTLLAANLLVTGAILFAVKFGFNQVIVALQAIHDQQRNEGE